MMQILFVEDNLNNCVLMHDYLEHFGYDVYAISDSRLFFPQLQAFQPDLILMDLKMPNFDGFALLEQLQHQRLTSKLPIIVLSALTFRKHRDRALALGARRFLSKPIEPRDLCRILQEELTLPLAVS